MIWKVSHFFLLYNQGWSESHLARNADTASDPVVLDCIALANARVGFLGNPAVCQGFRVSAYSDGGTPPAKSPRQIAPWKQVFRNPNQSLTWKSDPADVCYNLVGQTLPKGKTNITQLGAPLDNTVEDGGNVKIGNNGLTGLINAYTALLKAGQNGTTFGWGLSVSNPTATPLVNVSIATIIASVINGTIVVTTMAPAFGPGVNVGFPPFGQKFTARISRVNAGASALNRTFTFKASNATTAESVEQVAFGSAVGGEIRVYAPVRPFTPYAGDMTIQGQVGNHRRGRPIGSPRGRAPRRVLA